MGKEQLRVSQFQKDVASFLKLVGSYGGGNLTCNQMLILAEVWMAYSRDEPLYVSDIQQLCGMPKATASRNVATLSDLPDTGMGFLTIETDPTDRRRKRLLPSKGLIETNIKMSREFRELVRKREKP